MASLIDAGDDDASFSGVFGVGDAWVYGDDYSLKPGDSGCPAVLVDVFSGPEGFRVVIENFSADLLSAQPGALVPLDDGLEELRGQVIAVLVRRAGGDDVSGVCEELLDEGEWPGSQGDQGLGVGAQPKAEHCLVPGFGEAPGC